MSSILTPTGYKSIADCSVGDEVVYFDAVTGAPSVNIIETIQWVDAAEWARWWSVEPSVPAFQFYTINGTWTLNSEQSIWRNGTEVCHAKHLVVGDVIYDDANNDVPITSITPVTALGWYRFDISGDHSYIVDGLTLHNASRFLITGGGSVSWTSSNTAIWSGSSGGGTGSSVPGSADTVTMDGSSGAGTVTCNFGGTITVQSVTKGAYTGTFDNSVNNNNFSLSATTAWSGTGSATRTDKLGSATYTCTSTSTGASTLVTYVTTTGLTFTGSSATFEFSGAVGAGVGQSMLGGGLSYGTILVSGARFNSGINITGANTIGTLQNTAAATISLTGATTLTTLTQGAQLALSLPNNATLTLTNAPTLTGTLSAPLSLVNGTTTAIAGTSTLSIASGTMSGTYVAIQGVTFSGGATFSFTNSFDFGKNSGATITAPSAGTGISRARAFAGFA